MENCVDSLHALADIIILESCNLCKCILRISTILKHALSPPSVGLLITSVFASARSISLHPPHASPARRKCLWSAELSLVIM
jgi:hypothetical protein